MCRFDVRASSSPLGYPCAKFRFCRASTTELAREEKLPTQSITQSLTQRIWCARRIAFKLPASESMCVCVWKVALGRRWAGYWTRYPRTWQTGRQTDRRGQLSRANVLPACPLPHCATCHAGEPGLPHRTAHVSDQPSHQQPPPWVVQQLT